jgi:hypothetical protein
MIIYNVTVTIDEALREAYKDWMLTTHIPDVLQTGYFLGYQFHEMLEPAPEPGTTTFSVQYRCESWEKYQAYQQRSAPQLKQAVIDKFGDRFAAFRSVMRRF